MNHPVDSEREMDLEIPVLCDEWMPFSMDPDFDRKLRAEDQIRDKINHPYTYDSFTSWMAKDESHGVTKGNLTLWSDHLYRQNYQKYNDLCQKHFGDHGQYWGDRKASKIEQFLRDYTDDQTLKLMRRVENCNQSSGYPVWTFFVISKHGVKNAG